MGAYQDYVNNKLVGETEEQFSARWYTEEKDLHTFTDTPTGCANSANSANNRDLHDLNDLRKINPQGIYAQINYIEGNEFLKKEYKEPEYIVEDLIGTGLILFAGIGKVGKTTMMCWLIKSLVTLEPFLNFNIPRKRKIYYFNLEMTMNKLQEYFHTQNHKDLTNVDFYDKDNELNFETEATKFNHLYDIAEQGYELIIIDTLESFSPGLDHNDSKKVKPILQSLKNICDKFNTTIIVVDHNNKDNYDEEKDDFAAIRGSTTKTSAVDQSIVLRKFKDSGLTLATQGRGIGNKRLGIMQIPEMYGYDYIDGITPLDSEIKKDITEIAILDSIKRLGTQATTVNIARDMGQAHQKISRWCGKLQNKGILVKDSISQKAAWLIVKTED